MTAKPEKWERPLRGSARCFRLVSYTHFSNARICRQITWGSCYGEAPDSTAVPGRGLRSHISDRLSHSEEEAAGLWTTLWTVQWFLQVRAAKSHHQSEMCWRNQGRVWLLSKEGENRWYRGNRVFTAMTYGAGHPLSAAITLQTPIACLNSSMLDNGSASKRDEFNTALFCLNC